MIALLDYGAGNVRSVINALESLGGFDATNKWPGETDREWGSPIEMDDEIKARIDEIWDDLAILTEDNDN